jgi:ankyrin repeat protein
LVHPLFGPPVHTATGAGDVATLELLIEGGADVNARNPRGQTPLQQLAASRAIQNQLAQAQAMVRSMGVKVPNVLEQMSKTTLPIEGWDACEQVLKAHGAL